MKTKEEIEETILRLTDISERGQYQGSDTSEIDAKIFALEWVLGIQSDILD